MVRSATIVVVLAILAGLGTVRAGAPDSTTVRECPDVGEAYWNSKQPPDAVMDTIGVRVGMVVGEIGAGRGRYIVHVAKRVGKDGLVYANDIDSTALAYLRHRCDRDGIANVRTILGLTMQPRFPEGGLDLVYVINSYHHFERPVALLANTLPALKPDGRLVIIEHDPEKMTHGEHNRSSETVISEATQAGFELVRTSAFLEFDTIYIFRIAP